MNDDQINAAAVQLASESTGDFVAGANWAIGEKDLIRDQLWVTVYAQTHARGRIWFECKEAADLAAQAYDRRVLPK